MLTSRIIARVPFRRLCTGDSRGRRTAVWEGAIKSTEDMESLGAWFLRDWLRAGDVVLLQSDVGGGKSVFARGAIRAAMEDSSLPVPSPTFLLELVYGPALASEACKGALLRHYDLYRLQEITRAEEEAFEWDEALLRRDICFIEWPRIAEELLGKRQQDPSITGRIWNVDISEEEGSLSAIPTDDDILALDEFEEVRHVTISEFKDQPAPIG
mmetsp:Transcript_17119/g.33522  ORF Transcript_17119/g.33522 Transcript_17119/m.33522 type:complete len:213 (-) Transcript_17119:693-1331(-)